MASPAIRDTRLSWLQREVVAQMHDCRRSIRRRPKATYIRTQHDPPYRASRRSWVHTNLQLVEVKDRRLMCWGCAAIIKDAG